MIAYGKLTLVQVRIFFTQTIEVISLKEILSITGGSPSRARTKTSSAILCTSPKQVLKFQRFSVNMKIKKKQAFNTVVDAVDVSC